jgi:hypothetical protein
VADMLAASARAQQAPSVPVLPGGLAGLPALQGALAGASLQCCWRAAAGVARVRRRAQRSLRAAALCWVGRRTQDAAHDA